MSTKPADDDHDECDGCICDTDPSEYQQTEDHDLPPAKGGVVGDRKPRVKKGEADA